MTPSVALPPTTLVLPARYRGRLADRPVAALVCAGPSLESVDLEAVRSSGAALIALNRAYEWALRPHAWVGFDRPTEFSAELWYDASVPKLTHAQNRYCALPRGPGPHAPYAGRGSSTPNVAWLPVVEKAPPSRYWAAPALSWGLALPGNPLPEHRLTFLSCFRIAWELGVRELYLLGVDWRTSPEKSYAGDRRHAPAHCASLNRRFEAYGAALADLAPGFLARGLRVLNATPGSRLEAFPAASVADLVGAARLRNRAA